MSIDVIMSIKEAEAESEEIRKNSIEQSRKIIKDANTLADKLIEQAIDDAELEARRLLKQTEDRARLDADMKKAESVKDDDILIQKARESLDKVVDIFMERIVKTHGDS